jgi:predicted restriction endonuclease
MAQPSNERIRWRDNPDAVELGFDHYLSLIERRLRGDNVSLVQGLRRFYQEELGIDLPETQARGLMHRESSVFIDYVQSVVSASFLPNIEHWEVQGLDQFLEWKLDFYRARDVVAVDLDISEIHTQVDSGYRGSTEPPQRRNSRDSRVIRDSALSRFLKGLYSHQCQICRFTFARVGGLRYSETHHIRPLGGGHNGIDNETNMMVLCPNHHSMMDLGAIAIHPDLMTVIGSDDTFPEHQQRLQLLRHSIDRNFLEYHLETVFNRI